jgi:2-polyprenyl-6-methoxyphenol hydroxylase-like FAD-dependent oxidoreductase
MSAAEFDRAEVEPYSTDPGATRALLVNAALATGNVHISRRAEVRRLLRKGERVCGVCGVQSGHAFESRGRLVVGDDGGHSVVRQGLGIPLETRLFVFDFVAAAVCWPEQLPPDQVRLWLNPRALRTGIAAMAMIPRPGRCGTLLVPLPHDRVVALFAGPSDGFWNALAGLTTQAEFLRSQLRFSEDFVRIRRPYGHAPRYVADGAAILGDAAHPVSPAGGQGANAAIWDALSLADVAHDALVAGDLSRKSLARYEALRRPRNSGSVSFTTRAVWGLTILGRVPGLPAVIPSALRIADRLSFLKRSLFRAFATTFVTRERPKQRSR